MGIGESHKKGREGFDDAVDQLHQLIDRWENRLTLDNPRLVERYVKGELRLLCYIDWLGEKYLAIFEGKHPIGGSDIYVPQRRSESLHHPHSDDVALWPVLNAGDVEANGGGNKQPVFVTVIETPENPECPRPVTFVRFGRVDGIHRLLPHALYMSNTRAFVFIGVRGDGESAVVGQSAPVVQNEGARDVVERGSEILEDFANAERDVIADSARLRERIFALSKLRILLYDGGLDGFFEGVDETIQVTEMAFGPFDLYFRP